MGRIDSTGTFIGTIAESGFGLTKKGFPQAVIRLKAEQKYIEAAADMTHFKLEQPAYVDWSAFNEDTVAYLVLFNSADNFIPDGPGKTSLLNYEQIQIATGWEGVEFDSFANGALVGKKILFRVEENAYEGRTSLQVNWIDSADAAPERTLKTLDAAAIKGLNSKLQIMKTNKPKPATASKPAAANPTSAVTAAVPTPTPAVTASAPNAALAPSVPAAPDGNRAAASATTPNVPADTSPATPPSGRGRKPKTPPTPEPTIPTGPSAGVTQMEAWEYVNKNKGDNEDQVLEEAWLAALTEIAGTREETALTPADWAKVRDITVKDLAV